MPNNCSSCDHPQVREINARIRQGRPLTDISRWLDDIGTPITRQALARHARGHLGVEAPPRGRVPVSGDFLESVRDAAAEGLESGELAVSLKDGISAQKALDARAARSADRDLMLKIAMALTGNVTGYIRTVDPEVDVIEGEYRALLTAGAE